MEQRNTERLAETLGRLALEMQSQSSTEATLKTIISAAVLLLPEASWAGISLIENQQVKPAIPADPVAEELDRLQTELGEGPMFDALHQHHTVHVGDLGQESRWPMFVSTARERGVRAMLSFRLFTNARSLGALNVYGSEPGVFSDESVTVGELLAQHAAVALAGANAAEQFEVALASRDIIGQAKGILMHRDNLSGMQAFATLTRASQETNIKLVEVARWLVGEHEKKVSTSAP
ncbi:GAF and ANTAR domain-containing protein [Mycobacterium sp. WMMD1722]|uniref:GAF and ANTAR domain-containing protein n=1 Tax=Mycobacterium sp. WMMD1722 TaxID=3404117 RepID=UPI003BF5A286